MPIAGRLTTAGRIHLIPTAELVDADHVETVDGIILEMDEENTRAACSKFLNVRVAIWAADELVPHAGSPAMEPTPENMQHLAMRLEAAEDHLAREVRSNEAATRVRVDLEGRLALAMAENSALRHERQALCERAVQTNKDLGAEVDRLAAELADALSEVNRLARALAVADERD